MLIRILFLHLLWAGATIAACASHFDKSSSDTIPSLILISDSNEFFFPSGSDTEPYIATPPKFPGSLLRAFVAHLESELECASSILKDKPSAPPVNDNEDQQPCTQAPRKSHRVNKRPNAQSTSNSCTIPKRHHRK